MSKQLDFMFRLYIAGDTQNSMQALVNLTHFCQTYLADLYTIEVLDVFKEQSRALQDSVFMTPTLIKMTPEPVIKIVGTLSQTDILLQTLGLSDFMYDSNRFKK